jgi:hypothetical protein
MKQNIKFKVGDMVSWNGEYHSGFESGQNKIVNIVLEFGTIWYILDNDKQFTLDDETLSLVKDEEIKKETLEEEKITHLLFVSETEEELLRELEGESDEAPKQETLYTEEEVREALKYGVDNSEIIKRGCKDIERFIQSLKQPKKD